MPELPHGSIPSHLSEATFRRYESFLTRAVAAFPADTRMSDDEMTGLSRNTHAARARDAIVSVKRFKWSTTIDIQKLWSISGKYAIAHDPDGIWFRAKGSRGRPSDLMDEAREMFPSVDARVSVTPWANATHDEIRAVCLLIHNERITGPILLGGEIAMDVIKDCESTYNVGFYYDQQLNQTIIT